MSGHCFWHNVQGIVNVEIESTDDGHHVEIQLEVDEMRSLQVGRLAGLSL